MSEKLLVLCDGKKSKHASKILSTMKIEKVIEVLADEVSRNNEQSFTLLQNIFYGLSDDKLKGVKEYKISKKIFKVLNETDVSAKISSDIIGFLLVELDNFPVKELTEFNKVVLKFIQDGKITNVKSLELFCKILSILSSCTSIPTDDEGTMNGEEYKRATLNTLINSQWMSSMAAFIITMMRDIPLNDEELNSVVKKILKILNEIDVKEVAPLIYQSLLLTNKGSKKELLDGIVTFFYEKSKDLQPAEDLNPLLQGDVEDVNNLRIAEGKVLNHIISAVKQNQELGRIFIKYIKLESQTCPKKVFSPFSIALVLGMTQIHRLEEQLLDFMKSLILKSFKDDAKRNQSKWISDLFPDVLAVEVAMSTLLKNSTEGWECVSHGLIHLGFMLVDSYQAKISDNFAISSEATTPTQRACKLGAAILQAIFKQNEVRAIILQRLLDVIVLKATHNVQHYLDLLSSCIASVPQIVLDCLPKFREVFDYLSLLNLSTTEGLLRAVLPLMKVSMTVKDSLILVLKKSMFSKQEEARRIAVTGFLLILKHFKINTEGAPYSLSSQVAFSQSFSCSQLDINTQGRYNVAANEALCLEIIGNLRKSLTQHGDVRKNLYNGIYEVVCKNPRLSHAVLDLLYHQFIKYYIKEDDAMPPLNLNLCSSTTFGEMQLMEPLADLLYALQLSTKKSGKRLGLDEEEDELMSHLLDDTEDIFTSLSRRMAKADLEDFNLDKTVEYESTSEAGMKNQHSIYILVGIYEVLIEYNYMKDKNLKVETCELITQLFLKYQKVLEVIKDKITNNKKNKSSSNQKQTKNYFSFKCLSLILSSILCSTDAASEPALNILRQSIDFVKFIASSVLKKLTQVIETRHCDGAGGKNLDHIFRHSLILAQSFLKHINGDCLLSDEVLKQDKGSRKLGNLCLDGLCYIVGFVCKHLSGQIKALLRSLDFSPDVITQNDAVTDGSSVFRIVRRIQRMAIKIISSPNEDLGHKEALIFISMINYFIPHLDVNTELDQVYTWFYRLVTEHHIDDLQLSKTVLSRLLCLHHQLKGTSSTVTKISQDIHSQVGDIDEDIEVENRSHFLMITEKTAVPTSFLVVLHHVENVLDEVDWALNKLKNLPNLQDLDKDIVEESETCRETIIISISQTMIGMVLSLHELTQTAFLQGIGSDSITKVVTKLYTILGNFTKYHLQLYTQKSGNITSKFERLVKLTGSHLAQQVYTMITYVQSTQSQLLQEQTTNPKTKVKDKKKGNITGKNRALKESRSIPNLIYSIEQYERYLIQLSKKSKIDLMENIKRSTARDFRINAASLEAALQGLSEEDDDDVEISTVEEQQPTNVTNAPPEVLDLTGDDDPNENPPITKRQKLSSNRKPLLNLNKNKLLM